VILEPEERKNRAAVQMLATVRNSKLEKREVANKDRLARKKKDKQREVDKFAEVHRSEKKRKYTDIGKEQLARQRKKGR